MNFSEIANERQSCRSVAYLIVAAAETDSLRTKKRKKIDELVTYKGE